MWLVVGRPWSWMWPHRQPQGQRGTGAACAGRGCAAVGAEGDTQGDRPAEAFCTHSPARRAGSQAPGVQPGCLSPSDGWALAQCSPMSLRKVVPLAEDRGCCEKGGSCDSITESTGTVQQGDGEGSGIWCPAGANECGVIFTLT